MPVSTETQTQMENARAAKAASDVFSSESVQSMILLYVEAEQAVLKGQAYQIGGQSLTRADLDKIRKGRQEWMAIRNAINGSGRRISIQVIPEDS